MEITFREMGWVKHNDLNIRVRTAFINNDDEEIFLEVSTGVIFDKNTEERWLLITALFLIIDENTEYTRKFFPIIEKYRDLKLPYNIENLKKLLIDLNIDDPKIVFDDNYSPTNKRGYNFCNTKKKIKQSTIFDYLEAT